jgi:photosystem II stability/assembly factor-like uncharacterized protein
VKAAATLLFCASLLRAQAPVHVEFACTPEDIDTFGLACSEEDPCPVFLEFASVQALGAKVFLSGNLHTTSTTLFSILLMSDDGGGTWTEPHKRLRAAQLEQIQFIDFEHGWVGGQFIEPLPKDPFLLVTTDGGKTWRQSPLFEESRFGSISQFWFDSPTTGELIFDRSSGSTKRYEQYVTDTGGATWTATQSTSSVIRLKKAPSKDDGTWRTRTDAATKTFRIERRGATNWEVVASFAINVGDCK